MDLMKFTDELIEQKYPDLKPNFYGLGAVLGQLTFSARVNQKMTQKQLAEKAGLSPKTIHRIEGGSGGITDTTYQKVFAVLGVYNDDIADAFKKKSINRHRERELVHD
jgi:transcriptional regulator with XRE-family HTH domain